MKYIFIILCIMFVSACTKPAESSVTVGKDFTVETLFTHEGCTVYRFRDGYNRYFTNCKGDTSWSESCGKNVKLNDYDSEALESPVGVFCSNQCFGKHVLDDDQYKEIYGSN